jgi:hypothetical protein
MERNREEIVEVSDRKTGKWVERRMQDSRERRREAGVKD